MSITTVCNYPRKSLKGDTQMTQQSSEVVPTAPAGPGQQWFSSNFGSVADALTFLNEAPAQGPGEASVIARNDGTVGVFYLNPGSENNGQQWLFQNFASVADALTFLNGPPVRGSGEASTTVRNNGTVGLFYLDPA
jgi:hypothetical protein